MSEIQCKFAMFTLVGVTLRFSFHFSSEIFQKQIISRLRRKLTKAQQVTTIDARKSLTLEMHARRSYISRNIDLLLRPILGLALPNFKYGHSEAGRLVIAYVSFLALCRYSMENRSY